MASGWDQALAAAAVEAGIPWTAAVPFRGQESRWPAVHQEEYHRLLGLASNIHYVAGRRPDKNEVTEFYYARDRWMADQGDYMLALWDLKPSGGTFKTVVYAQMLKKPVFNMWPIWLKLGSPGEPG